MNQQLIFTDSQESKKALLEASQFYGHCTVSGNADVVSFCDCQGMIALWQHVGMYQMLLMNKNTLAGKGFIADLCIFGHDYIS